MSYTFCHQRPKPGQYHDAYGLVVVIRETGIYFEQRYTYNSNWRSIALGSYPQLSLVHARKKALANLLLVRAGKDPTSEKKPGMSMTLTTPEGNGIEVRYAASLAGKAVRGVIAPHGVLGPTSALRL